MLPTHLLAAGTIRCRRKPLTSPSALKHRNGLFSQERDSANGGVIDPTSGGRKGGHFMGGDGHTTADGGFEGEGKHFFLDAPSFCVLCFSSTCSSFWNPLLGRSVSSDSSGRFGRHCRCGRQTCALLAPSALKFHRGHFVRLETTPRLPNTLDTLPFISLSVEPNAFPVFTAQKTPSRASLVFQHVPCPCPSKKWKEVPFLLRSFTPFPFCAFCSLNLASVRAMVHQEARASRSGSTPSTPEPCSA